MCGDVLCQEEFDAGLQRILIVGDARAAGAARADLYYALDPAHLAGAPHRAGEAEADALHLVAPVDMGVDLQYRETAAPLECMEERDRNRIVAAQYHRHGAAVEQRRHGGGDAAPVAGGITEVKGQVAAIDRRDALGKHGSAEVEIHVVARRRPIGDAGADRRGPARAIGPDGRVGRRCRRAEDGDRRPRAALDRRLGQAEEGRSRGGAEHIADAGAGAVGGVRHDAHCFSWSRQRRHIPVLAQMTGDDAAGRHLAECWRLAAAAAEGVGAARMKAAAGRRVHRAQCCRASDEVKETVAKRRDADGPRAAMVNQPSADGESLW